MATSPQLLLLVATHVTVAQVIADAGCCFKFGYGAMMKPCCLNAKNVDSKSNCKVEGRAGGATGFTAGTCPATASEAADLWEQQQEEESLASPSPVAGGASAKACCFSIGYGSRMIPCCLTTEVVDDMAKCSSPSGLVGGAHGSKPGACPGTAAEASDLIDGAESDSSHVEVPVAVAPPVAAAGPDGVAAEAGKVGCCFDIGYGARMVPCCLSAEATDDVGRCPVSTLAGGAKSFKLGECPATAEEAAGLIRSAEQDGEKELTEASGEAPQDSAGIFSTINIGIMVVVACGAGLAFVIWKRPQQEGTTPLLDQAAE